MLLDGKVAVLSGVGPGLGRESALVFAREGASVVLVARDERRIAAVAGEVERAGGRALAVTADVLAEDQCRAAAARAAEVFGRIDALVNLAFAESSWKSLLDVDADLVAWHRAFDVNVFGTLRMTRAVAVLMAERGAGSIIMVNSIASAGTMPRIADYTGSKAALAGMTRTLARELGPHGIRVNGIHPGTMWGPYNERRFQAMADENGTTLQAERDRAATEVPLRYLPGSNEVAEVLAFFASDRARAITGQQLHVNAGQYLG